MFKILIIGLLFIVGFIKEKNQKERGTITIEFSGIKKENGYIELNVFNSEKGFPDDKNTAFKNYRVKMTSSKKIITIKNIPYGEYAVSCFYDSNNNKKLDTNFLGIPKEKVGTSNNSISSSIPNYQDAKFIFNKPEYHLSIILK